MSQSTTKTNTPAGVSKRVKKRRHKNTKIVVYVVPHLIIQQKGNDVIKTLMTIFNNHKKEFDEYVLITKSISGVRTLQYLETELIYELVDTDIISETNIKIDEMTGLW
eukprot:426553_1